MKNFRTTIILVIILVALGGFVLIFDNPSGKKESSTVESKVINLEKEEANKIEITKGDEKIILAKESGVWILKGLKNRLAHQLLINKFFEDFSNLELTDVISTNPEKQAVFEVDEDSGTRLVVLGEEKNKVLDLYIGKRGQTMNSNYLRYNKGSKVYLVNKYLIGLFDLSANDWIDKTIVSFDKEKLESFKIKVGSKETKFFKEENAWVKTKGKVEDNQEDLNQMVEIFSNFQGVSFVEDDPKDFNITITLKLTEGDDQVLKAKREDERALAKLEGSEDVFEVDLLILDKVVEIAK